MSQNIMFFPKTFQNVKTGHIKKIGTKFTPLFCLQTLFYHIVRYHRLTLCISCPRAEAAVASGNPSSI